MTVGIYRLSFSDGSFYIGKSVSIDSRYKDHCSLLRRNKSGSPKLQKKFNELLELPLLEVLEIVDIRSLSDREVYWISKVEATTKGLNILVGSQDTMVGENHPGSKYTNVQIYQVLELLASCSPIYTHIDIEKLTGVKVTTVKDIACESAHLWLKEAYPNTYQKMLDTKSMRKKTNSIANLNPQANKKTAIYPTIISPEGIEYTIDHLTNFANQHGLQPSNLSHVLSGRRQHTKGWKLKNASNN